MTSHQSCNPIKLICQIYVLDQHLKVSYVTFVPLAYKKKLHAFCEKHYFVCALTVCADEFVYPTHKTFFRLLGLRDITSLAGNELKLTS